MKSTICKISVAAFLSLCMITSAYGLEDSANENELIELAGLAGQNYYSETGYEQSDPEYQVEELYVVPSSLAFEYTNEVRYVDVIARLTDGSLKNVSEWASAAMDSDAVATYDMGRVDSVYQGSCDFEISYGGESCILEIAVESASNPYLTSNSNRGITPYNLAAGQVLSRANKCYDYTWTPTQNLTKWRGNGSYSANVTVRGLPYSQAIQAYPETYYGYAELSFTEALNYADFYTPYTSNEIVMPRYGLDCSAFLSYCIGTTRKNTRDFLSLLASGTYDAVGGYEPQNFLGYSGGSYYVLSLTTAQENTLIDAYGSAGGCHAGLVTNGHCMLIISNSSSTSRLTVREQTPSGTVERVYTYEQLANDGYLPFNFL